MNSSSVISKNPTLRDSDYEEEDDPLNVILLCYSLRIRTECGDYSTNS